MSKRNKKSDGEMILRATNPWSIRRKHHDLKWALILGAICAGIIGFSLYAFNHL